MNAPALKSEIRNPKSERPPKPEARGIDFTALSADYRFDSGAQRESDFGFQASFGFRRFGFRVSDLTPNPNLPIHLRQDANTETRPPGN
jgi:hypothetical protein